MAAGVEARAFVPEGTPPDQVLPAFAAALPAPVGTGFVLAMLAAVLSSADSCLITAGAVAARDILWSDSVALGLSGTGTVLALVLGREAGASLPLERAPSNETGQTEAKRAGLPLWRPRPFMPEGRTLITPS